KSVSGAQERPLTLHRAAADCGLRRALQCRHSELLSRRGWRLPRIRRHSVRATARRAGPRSCIMPRRDTYTHLTNWLTDARNLTNPSTTFLLIGNKKDMDAQREVRYEEASKFAQENGA